MKRDKELMLQILLEIELSEKNELFITRETEPEMIDKLYFHVTQLEQYGYVTYKPLYADDELQMFRAHLTTKGYDYLEELEAAQEADSNLSKAKGKITQATNWTMTNVVAPLLVEYTKSWMSSGK